MTMKLHVSARKRITLIVHYFSFQTSHDDLDLQLALALSKSLYEKEEMENWDEAQIVAISSSPSSLPDTNTESCQKTTLQSFGFTSSRSMSPVSSWPVTKNKRSTYFIYIHMQSK